MLEKSIVPIASSAHSEHRASFPNTIPPYKIQSFFQKWLILRLRRKEYRMIQNI
jgi:hypothetical protein